VRATPLNVHFRKHRPLTHTHARTHVPRRHAQPQAVSRGFTTEFAFRFFQDDAAAVASPCRVVDHAPEACTRRGGDGLALVLHTAGAAALGGAGAGLGYDGLPAGVALEFDTWADASAADPGDNHIAVLTRGNATLRRVCTTLSACGTPARPLTRVLNCAVCVRVLVCALML
jgi:hypothetical protein